MDDDSDVSTIPNRIKVPGFALLNGRLGFSFLNDRGEASVSVFNALDKKYREHPITEELDSRIVGSLSVRF